MSVNDDLLLRRVHQMHADGYISLVQIHGERHWALTGKGWATLCASADPPMRRPPTPSRAQVKAAFERFTVYWIK